MPQVDSVYGDDGGKTTQAHLFEAVLNVSMEEFAKCINKDTLFEQYAVFSLNGKCILLNVIEDLYWNFLDNGVWDRLGVESSPEESLQQMVNDTFKNTVTDYNKYLSTNYEEIMSNYIK